jgi:hypothetical protein
LSAFARAQDAGHVKITVAKANVRSEPNEKSAVLTQASLGATFDLRGVEGDWFKVVLYMGGMRAEAYISKKVATLEPATPTPPAAASTPAVAEGMSVVLQTAAGTSWLTPHVAQATASPTVTGAAGVNWTWTVDGKSTASAFDDRRPTFVVLFRDIPAVSADDVAPVLVRLAPTDTGARVVAVARGRSDASSRREADWDLDKELTQDVVRVETASSERGTARLRPAADLAPGEYAIVVRPITKKPLSGATVLSQSGEGRIFSAVFDFTIR